MEIVKFKLGSDPELMLRDTETKELRSAIPHIEEGKGKGRPLDDTGLNSMLHDNVLVEFNTKPAETCDEFVGTIQSVLTSASTILSQKGLELHLLTSTDFPEDELNCQEARMFGCEPDYDAYGLMQNTMPANAASLPFRSTGGHLHIGKAEDNEELRALLDDPFGKVRIVKALDAIVGIVSVFLDRDPTAVARRKLYGKAGCHRPTTYGVEWRACGPWWLASPQHTKLVYELTNDALAIALNEKKFNALIDKLGGEDTIQNVVNNSKVDEARRLFNRVITYRVRALTRELVRSLDREEPAPFKSAWGL